jgi:hypothetical protein
MAAAAPLYIFQGSNIGPNGVLNDALDIPEMFYAFQKKFFGLPNTIPDILYSSELLPSITSGVPNSFPYIQQNKIYGQTVPLPNPIATIRGGIPALSSNYTQDTTFINSNYVYFGCNMNIDTMSSRYYANSFPYICYYSNLLLSPITNNKARYPNTLYSNFTTTYAHPLLQNSIAASYDTTYYPIVYTNNGIQRIIPTDGYWLLDNDTGILIFYDSNTTVSQVNASNPPRISFFRYEGLFGEAGVTQGQYL